MKYENRWLLRPIFLLCCVMLLSIACRRSDSQPEAAHAPKHIHANQENQNDPNVELKQAPEQVDSLKTNVTKLQEWQTIESADKTYRIHFSPPAGAIPLNKPFTLNVKLEFASDPSKNIQYLTLKVDARMPRHHHGMNTMARVRHLADNQYEVSGMLLHMPGYWEFYFDITRMGMTERAQIGFSI